MQVLSADFNNSSRFKKKLTSSAAVVVVVAVAAAAEIGSVEAWHLELCLCVGKRKKEHIVVGYF